MPATRRQFVFSAAAIASLTVARLRGQQDKAQDKTQDNSATFSAGVKVVDLLATVRNAKGQIIANLTKDDFSLSEDGRSQTIRYFSQESDLPLTIGLLVDTSMSQERVLDAERTASFRFLDRVLRENKDQVFISQFDMGVRLRQDLTSSRARLQDALAYVNTPTRSELAGQMGGGTLLYDAIVEASKEEMANQRNRKALIVMSDGVDTGSDKSISDAIEAAQRADTLVYSIVFSDDSYYSGVPLGVLGRIGGENGRGVLSRISKETGGSCYEVTKKLGIDQIFEIFQNELRSQYSLGYVSDKPVRVSEFRKVQLTLNQKGLKVQARDRYWAQR
jgi:VWFA-related protein